MQVFLKADTHSELSIFTFQDGIFFWKTEGDISKLIPHYWGKVCSKSKILLIYSLWRLMGITPLAVMDLGSGLDV